MQYGPSFIKFLNSLIYAIHILKTTDIQTSIVSTHSETCTWHDKNIHSNAPYREVLTTQLNYLVSLAKWLSVSLRTKWLWVQVPLQSLKLR